MARKVPYVKEGESIALANITINVLTNGYKYDLTTRSMIQPKRTKAKGKPIEDPETAVRA